MRLAVAAVEAARARTFAPMPCQPLGSGTPSVAVVTDRGMRVKKEATSLMGSSGVTTSQLNSVLWSPLARALGLRTPGRSTAIYPPGVAAYLWRQGSTCYPAPTPGTARAPPGARRRLRSRGDTTRSVAAAMGCRSLRSRRIACHHPRRLGVQTSLWVRGTTPPPAAALEVARAKRLAVRYPHISSATTLLVAVAAVRRTYRMPRALVPLLDGAPPCRLQPGSTSCRVPTWASASAPACAAPRRKSRGATTLCAAPVLLAPRTRR
mmetsp:Transcript_81850/g.205974  ORF Transcript_81850/g.205974 Transcript_81850/m.205974 type:complete len:265 (+) Transcript_81850:252-1046(+)